MTRSRWVLINLICWTLGVTFVVVGGVLLDRWMQEGVLKTVVWWLVVGLAVGVFGGIPRAVVRRAPR